MNTVFSTMRRQLFTNLRIHIISLFYSKVYEARAENFRMRYPSSRLLNLQVSNGHTFDFLLKPFFLGYSREKSKTGFFHLESPFRFCI